MTDPTQPLPDAGSPGGSDLPTDPPPDRSLSALPSGPTPYHHFLRTPRARWWSVVVAVAAIIVVYVASNLLFNAALRVLSSTLGLALLPPETPGDGVITMTPALLLVNNLSIGVLVPVSMGLQRLLFGQPGRWLHSVHGRFRWRLALRVLAVLFPLWLVYGIVWTRLEPEAAGVTGAPATAVTTAVMVLAVVVSTPLQAAGEEYAARGLMARSFASLTGHPAAALVLALVPCNVLFLVAHNPGDLRLAFYTLATGVACSVLTWRTGGLEAAVVLHSVNNAVFALVAAFVTSGVVIDRNAGVGDAMLVPTAMMVLAAVVGTLWARRRGLARAADPTT